jgi:hypothetical protein
MSGPNKRIKLHWGNILCYTHHYSKVLCLCQESDQCLTSVGAVIQEHDKGEDNFICWSTGTSRRGESLMEYVVNSNLKILNQGKEPTFVTMRLV